jgi:hypothetical protein
MTRGVLLFAFNTDTVNYYEMAVMTAKRANQFLNLPVTLVTDKSSLPKNSDYIFDCIQIVTAQKDNVNHNGTWYNKGRYRAYELSPYDETILLDTDYLINGDMLLSLFEMYDDFMCHKSTSYVLNINSEQEIISARSFNALWATVVLFKKTQKVKQIFECLEMIQNNYNHYGTLYNFATSSYRNDYGLTIALRIVNGHLEDTKNYIPWSLLHVAKDTRIQRITDTKYKAIKNNKYTILEDTDFHMMDKTNFMELT